MVDAFSTFSDSPSDPSEVPFAIIPSDVAELALIPKAIYVGTGGSVTLRGVAAGADVVFKNLASGQVLDVRAQYVRSTGTTATDLIGLA